MLVKGACVCNFSCTIFGEMLPELLAGTGPVKFPHLSRDLAILSQNPAVISVIPQSSDTQPRLCSDLAKKFLPWVQLRPVWGLVSVMSCGFKILKFHCVLAEIIYSHRVELKEDFSVRILPPPPPPLWKVHLGYIFSWNDIVETTYL